jgi:catechol 2,3-dioxygenase-like lactoylglutathione lyase family enzyme
MTTRIASALLFAMAVSAPLRAQLAAPNAAGISMGHMHLYVSDVAEHQKFWKLMGGVPVANQKLEMIQFPGMMLLIRKGDTSGSAGTIVNHFGFVWKDLPTEMAKWKAAGYKIEQEDNPNQGYIIGPDGIRLEFFGDPSIKNPVEMNHIHLYPQDIPAMQAWYAKVFGGVAGKRARVRSPGWIDCVDVPGVNLSMSQGETKLEPTVGHVLDHIGFEVKDLPAFLKRIEEMGVKPEPMRPSNFTTKMRVAFVTDPWGTKIELTEGLQP